MSSRDPRFERVQGFDALYGLEVLEVTEELVRAQVAVRDELRQPVGLVHARAMTFSQALGVVMGANIGTTVSSQIYALDAVKYGPALLLPGLLLHWLGRSETARHVGGAGRCSGWAWSSSR